MFSLRLWNIYDCLVRLISLWYVNLFSSVPLPNVIVTGEGEREGRVGNITGNTLKAVVKFPLISVESSFCAEGKFLSNQLLEQFLESARTEGSVGCPKSMLEASRFFFLCKMKSFS